MTVDVVVLTLREGRLEVVLIERGETPYLGAYALPGGFIRPDETLDEAAARELAEETGVDAAGHIEQFHAYGDPLRDPRMRVVTVAYLAIIPDLGAVKGGSDARTAQLVGVDGLLSRRPTVELAFDHDQVLRDGVEAARTKLETTSVATSFVGREFTLSQLRSVYEAAWGIPLDPGNFRRKVLASPRFVTPTGRVAAPGPEGGKPAELYRSGSRRLIALDPPLRRPRRRGA